MPQEPTNKEILDKIDKYADTTEKRFEQMELRFDKMETHFDDLTEAIQDFAAHTEERFNKLESEMETVTSEVRTIKATMVTKDYLDDKLADLHGDLVVLMRKEDTKVKTLVDILETHNVISESEVKKILSMEPFPQVL